MVGVFLIRMLRMSKSEVEYLASSANHFFHEVRIFHLISAFQRDWVVPRRAGWLALVPSLARPSASLFP